MTALPLDMPDRRPALLMRAAAILALVALACLVLIAFDPRPLDGERIWLKPLKFAAALALFLATLHWGIRALPAPIREGRWLRVWTGIAIATATAEMVWIASAAALGTRSHYNVTVPWLQTLYETAMGPIAVLLALSAAAFGWPLLRHGWSEVERATGWAFIATAALTIPVGMALSFAPVEGAGLPLLGWTLAPGDLRPAHFMATHAMQAIPLAALALVQFGTLSYRTGLALTLGWSALTLAAAAYGMGWI
ncbi:hypothetical protein [Jannaschia aquimarina]|uniref:Uncharacterized protein n=1 Tax=Jannaschia aquimarina TaxID=935700 RepID=A0A0D1CLD8_9RHOB|nr:hypothetical protein [Jannaschia aquimarina]KIT15627.1 hypothetical protein jaqu_26080 [Jannaschia aquimarina]SNT02901.1 hypothetical protein SAMN05421775_104303 [Jannaschia aquimarina]